MFDCFRSVTVFRLLDSVARKRTLEIDQSTLGRFRIGAPKLKDSFKFAYGIL